MALFGGSSGQKQVKDGPRPHVYVVTAKLRVEAPRVVGPQIERASRFEVEPGVMPMARDEPGLHGSL